MKSKLLSHAASPLLAEIRSGPSVLACGMEILGTLASLLKAGCLAVAAHIGLACSSLAYLVRQACCSYMRQDFGPLQSSSQTRLWLFSRQ